MVSVPARGKHVNDAHLNLELKLFFRFEPHFGTFLDEQNSFISEKIRYAISDDRRNGVSHVPTERTIIADKCFRWT